MSCRCPQQLLTLRRAGVLPVTEEPGSLRIWNLTSGSKDSERCPALVSSYDASRSPVSPCGDHQESGCRKHFLCLPSPPSFLLFVHRILNSRAFCNLSFCPSLFPCSQQLVHPGAGSPLLCCRLLCCVVLCQEDRGLGSSVVKTLAVLS